MFCKKLVLDADHYKIATKGVTISILEPFSLANLLNILVNIFFHVS